MLSGLFDAHPDITIILGHLREGLPFTLPRLEHRLSKQREGIGRGLTPLSHNDRRKVGRENAARIFDL